MSHDTDKLIRQLSLVAFLMAERRPLTARDVKGNVEGYSEMSDEAFARRFYSDRAELLALGVPLDSQRDEFTGEELYTLRKERYFLRELSLEDEELAALQTGLYLLEGNFAYAEPLRLALQNLALGRPGFEHPPTETADRVEMRDEERERTVDPYALLLDGGRWYVIGRDHDREAIRTFRVSRIRGDIRLATRRERDFRLPEDFDVESYRGRANWQIGDITGEARIDVAGDTAWWVERVYGRAGRIEDGVFVTDYASLAALARWILRQDGRAVPQSPPDLRRTVKTALQNVRKRHEGDPPKLARAVARDEVELPERPGSPVAPERFGLLQALLAYLLDACGEGKEAEIPATELVERFHIPPEALEEHLSLLNLVNFGGGCYAVYAELRGDHVHVDKELFGPMMAAEAHTPLERVRRKLEETFGEFELAQTPEPDVPRAEEDLVSIFSDAIRERRLVEIEYMKEGEKQPTSRVVEPYQLERELPNWYLHAFDPKNEASRSFRLDLIRSAKKLRERFERRPEFDPQRFGGTQTVRIWYSPEVARWEIERGATPLADGSAVREIPAGEDWLVGEILSYRGEAAVLEPADLRKRVAARAKELARELNLSRVTAAAR